MFHREAMAAWALVGLITSTAPSFAMGAIGCNNLPEHDQAVATLENGPYSCGMSTEQAKRILAQASPAAPTAPKTHARRTHRRTVPSDR